jgi:hypothetical protein
VAATAVDGLQMTDYRLQETVAVAGLGCVVLEARSSNDVIDIGSEDGWVSK